MIRAFEAHSCPHHTLWDRCGPPFFRAFHALAVDDAGSGTGLPLGLFAAFLVEFIMQIVQRAVIRPALEIAIDRAAWRQVAGDVAPCATGAQHIHDAVDDLPHVNLPPTSASPRRRDHSLDLRPLLLGQVAGVAQLVPVVPRPVLGVPHKAPRESMPASESRKFNGFKPPRLTDSNDSRSSQTDTHSESPSDKKCSS